MRTFLIFAAAMLVAAALYAVTNVTVTVPLSEANYTNMTVVASNHSMTVEEFFADILVRQVDQQQRSLLMDLWDRASPAQKQRALDALKN